MPLSLTNNNIGVATEIENLQYNPEINKSWCLKRIPMTVSVTPNVNGSTTPPSTIEQTTGVVLFLQAIKINENNEEGYEIKITKLQGNFAFTLTRIYIYVHVYNLLIRFAWVALTFYKLMIFL